MTETEALEAIRAVMGDWDAGITTVPATALRVREILARVGSGAVPPHDIDRDALDAIWPWHWNQEERDTFTDKVLALVRPVEGVVLEANEQGKVHVENGWRIRRTYVVGEPGELVERLGASS